LAVFIDPHQIIIELSVFNWLFMGLPAAAGI